MIDGSEKRNRKLAFELQNSHVCEKRNKLLLTLTSVQLRLLGRRFLDTLQKRTIRRTRNRTKNGHETDKKSDKKLEKKSDNIWTKHRTRTRTKNLTKKNRAKRRIRSQFFGLLLVPLKILNVDKTASKWPQKRKDSKKQDKNTR